MVTIWFSGQAAEPFCYVSKRFGCIEKKIKIIHFLLIFVLTLIKLSDIIYIDGEVNNIYKQFFMRHSIKKEAKGPFCND